jgi:hypothetical protein
MVCFQTKNIDLGKFWRKLEWKMLVYLMTIWNILWHFGIICGRLVKFVTVWYSLWPFGIIFNFGMIGPRKIWQPSLAVLLITCYFFCFDVGTRRRDTKTF